MFLSVILLSSGWAPLVNAQSVFHASDFGAVGNGQTLVTTALQRAVDAASAAGGGEVELKPGVYLTGALFLKSHIHLVLDKGAVVLGTPRKDLYPLVATRAAGIEMQWPAALLNIAGQTDVSIEGQGTIDGDGDPWWKEFWNLVPAYESRGLRWAVDYDVQRPELIRIFKSNSVRIGNGLLLRRSAFWTVHICYSTHVVVSGVTVRDNDGDVLGPSTDGVDIDSSSHVLVEKVDIENNDDGICLKAGMNADGLRVNRPTEDVVIRDSIIRQGISGIAIGSDTAGGFKNIKVYGITILRGVHYGIYVKSTHTRGGWTDDVTMSHIVMVGVPTAIKIDLNYFPAFSTPKIPPGVEKDLPPNLHAVPEYWRILTAPVDPAKGVPHFRDVTLKNIRASGIGTAISVNAAPDAPLMRFTLKDIRIDALHAGSISHAREWTFQNVIVDAQDGAPLKLEDVEQSRRAIEQLR